MHDAITYPECKHRRTRFIASERGPGAQRRRACVCADCGLFIVWIDGQQWTFILVTDEHVAAAGVYARYLAASE